MAKLTLDKLQHIYDLHAGDFGLSENKNPRQLQKLHDAIESRVTDALTEMFQGLYRGRAAKLHYNSLTQNIVVTDEGDNVIAAFKASPAQTGYIIATGRLS